MAFSMVLSIINKICTSQTRNVIFANQSEINYSINTRHMTSNGLISLTRRSIASSLYKRMCVYIPERTGGHFACSCVHPLNDNSVGASNLMAGNGKLA